MIEIHDPLIQLKIHGYRLSSDKNCFCKGFKGPSLSYADIHTDGVDFNLLATNAEKEIKRNYFIIVLFVNAGEVYFGIDNFFRFCVLNQGFKKNTPLMRRGIMFLMLTI